MKSTQHQEIATQSPMKGGTRVRFLDGGSNANIVVACETDHPGGMLAPLVKGLSSLQLEVHHIESRVSDGVRSERLLVASADGQPLSQRRQELLRDAVFTVMDWVQQAANVNHAGGTELNAS